jgi:acetolactate synthase I/III small subunit
MNSTKQMKRRAILAYMQNRPGVLNKVTMLIRRKMYNVDTITVCATRTDGISRMSLMLHEDSDEKMLQVIKQIEKITEVVSAKELDIDHSFWREVAIIKLEVDPEHLERLSSKYAYEILDHQSSDLYIVQVAGTNRLIDDFLNDLGDERIVEVARSGFTALEK